MLFKNPCYATAWYYAFNGFHQVEFTHDDLLEALADYKELHYSNSQIVKDSLNKDINCILRMYVEQDIKKGFVEDSIDSPFVELGLIHKSSDGKHYIFNTGTKANLPSELIVYCCLDFASSLYKEVKTINISRLLYDEGSPGLVLKLTQSALCEAIEDVASRFDKISLSDTASVIQLFYYESPDIVADELLRLYYNRNVLAGGRI